MLVEHTPQMHAQIHCSQTPTKRIERCDIHWHIFSPLIKPRHSPSVILCLRTLKVDTRADDTSSLVHLQWKWHKWNHWVHLYREGFTMVTEEMLCRSTSDVCACAAVSTITNGFKSTLPPRLQIINFNYQGVPLLWHTKSKYFSLSLTLLTYLRTLCTSTMCLWGFVFACVWVCCYKNACVTFMCKCL